MEKANFWYTLGDLFNSREDQSTASEEEINSPKPH
jgi:hypothetical protein